MSGSPPVMITRLVSARAGKSPPRQREAPEPFCRVEALGNPGVGRIAVGAGQVAVALDARRQPAARYSDPHPGWKRRATLTGELWLLALHAPGSSSFAQSCATLALLWYTWAMKPDRRLGLDPTACARWRSVRIPLHGRRQRRSIAPERRSFSARHRSTPACRRGWKSKGRGWITAEYQMHPRSGPVKRSDAMAGSARSAAAPKRSNV